MREILELRNENTKTYDHGNGKRTIEASISPIHYNNNGSWEPFDTTIENGVVSKVPYIATLLDGEFGYRIVKKEDGKEIVCRLKDIEGVIPTYFNPTCISNKATWTSIVNGLDLEIRFYPTRVRVWRKIYDENSPHKITWEITENSVNSSMKISKVIEGFDSENKSLYSTREKEGNDLKDTFTKQSIHRDKKNRVKELKSDVVYPVWIDADVDVTANSDGLSDYFKSLGFTTSRFGTGYNSGYPFQATTYVNYKTRDKLFFRFTGITIPQSATIDDATLTLNVISLQYSNPASITINAKDLNDPAAPVNFAQCDNPGTLATANKATILSSTGLKNIDVKTIVQELVNSYDYSNEAMLFFAKGKAQGVVTVQANLQKAKIEFMENAGTNPARLVINYTAGGGSSIKTWNGLADASVKTFNGLARASVKTMNGLA